MIAPPCYLSGAGGSKLGWGRAAQWPAARPGLSDRGKASRPCQNIVQKSVQRSRMSAKCLTFYCRCEGQSPVRGALADARATAGPRAGFVVTSWRPAQARVSIQPVAAPVYSGRHAHPATPPSSRSRRQGRRRENLAQRAHVIRRRPGASAVPRATQPIAGQRARRGVQA